MNSFNFYIRLPRSGQWMDGWMVGAGFGLFCNSSTASGGGTTELNS